MSRRIAIVKPDWGIRGGFELVVDRVVAHLTEQGDDVRVLAVPAPARTTWLFGERIDDELRAQAPELVTYLGLVQEFSGLDVHRADLVISTQPPSFAVPAPRHLSIFFHHLRVFYDLEAVATEAGVVQAEELATGRTAVRTLDQEALDDVTWFLAGSPTVRRRLETFNGLRGNVGLFLAGTEPRLGAEPPSAMPTALCVSRHEFAKRTELFVRAMGLLPRVAAVSVGTGGRRGYVQHLAQSGEPGPGEGADRASWCCAAPWLPAVDGEVGGIHFTGHVSDDELAAYYRDASCVVAPALDEDYGLTALEAMAHGTPVVVCADGGGLVDLVDHEQTGLVVEPTATAIAAAVERLSADPELAATLGANGRDVAASYTWRRAMQQVDDAIETVLAS